MSKIRKHAGHGPGGVRAIQRFIRSGPGAAERKFPVQAGSYGAHSALLGSGHAFASKVPLKDSRIIGL